MEFNAKLRDHVTDYLRGLIPQMEHSKTVTSETQHCSQWVSSPSRRNKAQLTPIFSCPIHFFLNLSKTYGHVEIALL